jgi:hypothetical protein
VPAHVGDRSGRSSIVGMPTDPAVRDASGDVVLCGRHRWRGLVGVPEPVKAGETSSYADLMSASGVGSLIQATVGSLGGRGRRCPNRAGLAL